MLRMIPSHQCLCSHNMAVLIELSLIIEFKFVSLYCRTQITQQLSTLAHGDLQRRVEEADSVAAVGLGSEQRNIQLLEQFLQIVSAWTEQRRADAAGVVIRLFANNVIAIQPCEDGLGSGLQVRRCGGRVCPDVVQQNQKLVATITRNHVCCGQSALQIAVGERAQLLSDLRAAIERHEFELYYQAQLDQNSHIVGAEALVRWKHPQQGLLSPAAFLPLAEQAGLMVKLGQDILQMGMQQLQSWQADPERRHLKLSINITADQFYEKNFETNLLGLLEEYTLDANGLMLEFTESMLLHDISTAGSIINRLNNRGIKFSIDDFGTGYSSLSYLSRLPMNQLKIDQSFVRNIGQNDKDMAIIRTIIDMAHTLNMEVLAEGVEKDAQHNYLLRHGCNLFQGYLFSKPVPLQSFHELLSRSQ